MLARYAQALAAVDSRLVIVSSNQRIEDQLTVSGITDVIGPDGVYMSGDRLGAATEQAQADAVAWIAGHAPQRDDKP